MIDSEKIENLISGYKRSVPVLLAENLEIIGALIERGLSYRQIATILSKELDRKIHFQQISLALKRYALSDPTIDRRHQIIMGIRKFLDAQSKNMITAPKESRVKESGQGQSDEKRQALNDRVQKLQSMASIQDRPKLAKADATVDSWNG